MCASIGSLGLGRRFDLVLLLSHLVNGEDGQQMLWSAARHVTHDGAVLVQRLEPARTWEPSVARLGPVTLSLDSVTVDGDIVQATTQYTLGERTWRQPWRLRVLDDAALTAMANRVSLAPERMDGAWACLRPALSAPLEPASQPRAMSESWRVPRTRNRLWS